MSAPKRGLGRGLGALLGDTVVPTSPAGEHLREVPVDQIKPNPFQPRQRFDQTSLDELRASIAEYGVLVPIIVRERSGGYELIAGERRWRACAALQKATIPAIVRRSDDRDSLEVAIIENLQREDLNPLEEAAGFAQLLEEHGFTQEQLSQRLGKSRPAIANALRLLALDDAIKAMLVDRRLSVGHARALLAAPAADRLKLAQRIVNEGLSVRATERLTGAVATPVKSAPAPASSRPLTPEQAEFEQNLRMRLGTRVALRRSGDGGKIEIGYADEGDLIRIAEILLGEQ